MREKYTPKRQKLRKIRKNIAVAERQNAAMSITAKFTDHPRDVGESYAEHAAMASGFGLRLLLAGMACLVHAVFPFLFEKTGSRTIVALHERMVAHRRQS